MKKFLFVCVLSLLVSVAYAALIGCKNCGAWWNPQYKYHPDCVKNPAEKLKTYALPGK